MMRRGRHRSPSSSYFIGTILMVMCQDLVALVLDLLHRIMRALYHALFISVSVDASNTLLFSGMQELLSQATTSQNFRTVQLESQWKSSSATDAGKVGLLRPQVLYLPALSHVNYFWYGYRIIFVAKVQQVARESWAKGRRKKRKQKDPGGSLVLSTFAPFLLQWFSWNQAEYIFSPLFQEVLERQEEEKHKVVWTYIVHEDFWSRDIAVPNRLLESVILPGDLRQQVVDDFSQFQSSAELYQRIGIQYRRMYLIHGPSGSGKTSLVTALASHFKRSLAVCSFRDFVDNFSFENLLNVIPNDTILLVEQVDEQARQENLSRAVNDETVLSMEGMMFVLDNSFKNDGQVIIFTATQLDRVPNILLKRMDKQIQLNHANRDQMEHLALRLYPSLSPNIVSQISSNIPEFRYSMSQLQGFLVKYGPNEKKLIEQVGNFLQQCDIEEAQQRESQEEMEQTALTETLIVKKKREMLMLGFDNQTAELMSRMSVTTSNEEINDESEDNTRENDNRFDCDGSVTSDEDSGIENT